MLPLQSQVADAPALKSVLDAAIESGAFDLCSLFSAIQLCRQRAVDSGLIMEKVS